MATFVLVPGAGGMAWYWHRVAPLIRAAGHDEFLTDPTAGELRIGSTQGIANGVLVAILDRLSTQRPRLAFHVKVGDTGTLLNHDLRERNIDLFFGRMGDIKEDDLNTEILFEEPFFVVAGINSRWTRCRKLTLKHLIG